ncbi:RNA-binding S4 domain-containing protein [Enteractinococcus fodinae]|uniref:Ribosome-associated protein n=1 Tax=Enteractinococcus fodinae TaxID=684663 RepID=A0ABU2B223_9MICC|nr:RNA-binding S4 domain-containing protein [Enteractinococcus fodinae]MDR7347471.1 ribosome-associated protein [Enteractinococcus fodinae]
MSTNSETLIIRDEMIRLGQALKLANVVEDGVDAREVISAGEILVNDEVETRRGRQLRAGDVITITQLDLDVIIETE